MHIRKTEDQRFNSLRSESGKVAEFKTSSSSFQSAVFSLGHSATRLLLSIQAQSSQWLQPHRLRASGVTSYCGASFSHLEGRWVLQTESDFEFEIRDFEERHLLLSWHSCIKHNQLMNMLPFL